MLHIHSAWVSETPLYEYYVLDHISGVLAKFWIFIDSPKLYMLEHLPPSSKVASY